MGNTTTAPHHKGQAKDTKGLNQTQVFYRYLQSNIATASMASKATGIPQKNICRYKRQLEKAGVLWELVKRICKVTGFKAWYLTTDKAKAPQDKNTSTQLNLFSHEGH